MKKQIFKSKISKTHMNKNNLGKILLVFLVLMGFSTTVMGATLTEQIGKVVEPFGNFYQAVANPEGNVGKAMSGLGVLVMFIGIFSLLNYFLLPIFKNNAKVVKIISLVAAFFTTGAAVTLFYRIAPETAKDNLIGIIGGWVLFIAMFGSFLGICIAGVGMINSNLDRGYGRWFWYCLGIFTVVLLFQSMFLTMLANGFFLPTTSTYSCEYDLGPSTPSAPSRGGGGFPEAIPVGTSFISGGFNPQFIGDFTLSILTIKSRFACFVVNTADTIKAISGLGILILGAVMLFGVIGGRESGGASTKSLKRVGEDLKTAIGNLKQVRTSDIDATSNITNASNYALSVVESIKNNTESPPSGTTSTIITQLETELGAITSISDVYKREKGVDSITSKLESLKNLV